MVTTIEQENFHKNEIPRLCAQNNILNQKRASEAKLKQVTR